MASRYWVGGTGTWDASSTTHWASASGGVGGASVPITTDDVFFDANSGGGTVTINAVGGAQCHDLDFTGSTCTIASTLNTHPSGNVTLAAGGTYSSFFLQMTPGSGLTKTLTFNGKSLNALEIKGADGTAGVTFSGTSNVVNALTLTTGVLATGGSNGSWGKLVSATTNSRTLTLGASAISIFWASGIGWDMSTVTNLTITANTAVITFAGASVTVDMSGSALSFNGASLVFSSTGSSTLKATTIAALTVNNSSLTLTLQAGTVTGLVTLTAGTLDTNSTAQSWGQFSSSGSGVRTLTLGSSTITFTASPGQGSYVWNTGTTTNFTFNAGTSTIVCNQNGTSVMVDAGGISFFNFSRVPSSGNNVDELGFASDATFTGTLTLTGKNNNDLRLLVYGTLVLNVSTFGTRTLTAAAVSLTNVDFISVTAAGAATWSGTSIGDGQGNSGITFTPAVTRYGVVAGTFGSTATWSTSSGGSGGASVPLCHDTIILDANSGAGTYTCNLARPCKDLICTGFTRTLTSGTTVRFFGSVTLGSGMTLTWTGSTSFCGRTTCMLTSAGKTWGGILQVNAVSGTLTLQDALTTTGASLRVICGTLDLNGFTATAPLFINQVTPVSTTPNIAFGGGTLVLNGTGTVWNVTVTMTTSGGGIVDITDTSSSAKTFAGNANTYGFTLRHVAAGTASLTFGGGAITLGGLILTCASARTVTFPTTNITINGPCILNGGTVGNELTVVSATPSNAVTFRLQGGGNRVNGADLLPSTDIKFKTPSSFFGASLAAH
jgi:hypothetical protein